MSKKSHPGDGSHGKGAKGNRPEFDELFNKKSEDATASVVTHDESQQEVENKDGE